MILYLHGFRSSPQSYKARLLAQELKQRNKESLWHCPQLPPSPAQAIYLANQLISTAQEKSNTPLSQSLTLIGSSLGGYYANWLAEHWQCRAVVLNPALYPADSLAGQTGTLTAYHSNKPFEFRPEYLDELRSYAVPRPSEPKRYYLLACKGDEVLDWRDMANWYEGSYGRILEGGDHGISDFATWLPEVLDFALQPALFPSANS